MDVIDDVAKENRELCEAWLKRDFPYLRWLPMVRVIYGLAFRSGMIAVLEQQLADRSGIIAVQEQQLADLEAVARDLEEVARRQRPTEGSER